VSVLDSTGPIIPDEPREKVAWVTDPESQSDVPMARCLFSMPASRD